MAFLEKLNKMAKNIEDKTGDALEISKYTAQKAKAEAAHREELRKIGKFYYDFYLAGGQIETEIVEVMQSAKAHADAVEEAQALIDGIRDENALERLERQAEKEAEKEAPAAVAEQLPAEEPVPQVEIPEAVTETPETETAAETAEQAEALQTEKYKAEDRICSVCGNKVDAGVKFCGECGNKMEV